MPGTAELFGGIASGFVGAKNQAKQTAILENYRKAESDYIKTRAKHEQAKLDLETTKLNTFLPILQQAMGQAGAPPAPIAPLTGQAQPQAQTAPQSLPEMLASMRNPINPAGGQAPALTGTTGRSLTNNNPANLEFRPNSYQSKYGAQPEPQYGRFAAFPTMEAGYNALLDQIRLDQSRGHTLASFVNKFSPAFENPTANLITTYAAQLGVTPDTPIANIPAEKLAIPIMARESSTKTAGGGLGQPQTQFQQVAQQPTQPQAGIQEYQPIRTITQKDALAAAWKFFSGAELKDEKYDYRVVNKDIMVFKDGQLVRKIPGGPDISWHTAANGDLVALDSKTLKPMQVIPMPAQMVKVEGQTPGGAPYTGWVPQPKYPGQPTNQTQPGMPGQPENPPAGVTGGIVTGPGERQKAKKLPEAIDQYIAKDLEPVVATMDYLKNFAVQKKNVFGFLNQQAFKLSKGEYTGPTMAGTIGMPSDDVIDFWNTMKDVENLKVHAFGGSNLTAQELKRALQALPNAVTPETFLIAVEAVKKAAIRHKAAINKYYSMTDEERAIQSEIDKSGGYELPQGMSTPPKLPGDRNKAKEELRRRGVIK